MEVDRKIDECGSAARSELGEKTNNGQGNNVLKRPDRTAILSYASRIWEGQESIARAMTSEAVRIISEAYEKTPSFFCGRSRKWVLGGLFYLLGQKRKEPKTQKQIARILDTNETTVRNSYQNWACLSRVLKMC
jgi:transcription initiation factor TFIIIB Brf1 subunit/transcription initiation factor TFIIB